MTKPSSTLRDKMSPGARARAAELACCLLLTALPGLTHAEPAINYCHDPTVAADWERLLTKYEGDPDFQRLYTLRQKLCAGVDDGRAELE